MYNRTTILKAEKINLFKYLKAKGYILKQGGNIFHVGSYFIPSSLVRRCAL